MKVVGVELVLLLVALHPALFVLNQSPRIMVIEVMLATIIWRITFPTFQLLKNQTLVTHGSMTMVMMMLNLGRFAFLFV